MSAPVLETDRLILRPHGVQDFEALAALWSDPQVVRHITGTPSSREASWSRLLRYIGHWQALGYGYWAVTLRETGQYLGDVGFADFHREVVPPLDGVPEAGWVIAPAVQGRGLATEAVARMHRWAEAETRWARSCCLIDPAQAISRKLALGQGYVAEEAPVSCAGRPSLRLIRRFDR